MFKKADILLALFLIVLCASSFYFTAKNDFQGDSVQVSVNNSLYGTYDLNKNRTVEIKEKDHLNIIEIKDGSVAMIQADCKNQVCVHQGAIRKGNQSILCLPNKIVVEIIKQESDMDAITY